jgi:micrococcal nuclease
LFLYVIELQVRSIERDRYGRTVAELFLGNQSVNLMMVADGQAVVYPQYLNGCSETKEQYIAVESIAKAQKLGFWNQDNPVMPWDYRRGKRLDNRPTTSASPRPQPLPSTAASPTPATSTAKLPACTQSDCDCKDFKTQAEAKRVLDAFPGDPFDLDRDKDGVPCESLP